MEAEKLKEEEVLRQAEFEFNVRQKRELISQKTLAETGTMLGPVLGLTT